MKIRNMTVKEVREETGESLQGIRVKLQRRSCKLWNCF